MKRRHCPPGLRLMAPPYETFLEAIEPRQPDAERARQALEEAEAWKRSQDEQQAAKRRIKQQKPGLYGNSGQPK